MYISIICFIIEREMYTATTCPRVCCRSSMGSRSPQPTSRLWGLPRTGIPVRTSTSASTRTSNSTRTSTGTRTSTSTHGGSLQALASGCSS